MKSAIKPLLRRILMIEDQIKREQKTRWPDWLRLNRLKKLRLAIKDKILRVFKQKKSVQSSAEGYPL